jgi:hypothetical protein
MAGKAKNVVKVGFSRTDPMTGLDDRYEVGDPYDGPDQEEYLEWGLIVPASAGSNKPSNEEGSA